jgi:uncharacterized protein YggE
MTPHRPTISSSHVTHAVAVVATLAVLVAGWLLGHQGAAITPAAAADTGSTPSVERARDGVLVSGTGEVTGRPDTLVATFGTYDSSGNHVTGYQAQQQLTVTMHDVSRAGEQIGAAVAAGGDAARLSGLTFRIDDDSALLTEARRNAFADAKAKAKLYGEQAGRGLSRVVSVTETVNGADTPYPVPTFGAAAGDSRTVKVDPGQQQLSVTVTVEWAFS